MSENPKADASKTQINYEDAPTLPPPRLEVGAVAWLRHNLFGSPTDTIITILSTLFILVIVYTFFDWAIGWANWYAIINNQRLFMLDRFEPVFEWRVALTVLIAAALTGVSFAVWARRSLRTLTIASLIILGAMAILPTVIEALIPMPSSYLAAGNVEIVDRADTILPQQALAFIAQEGEQVSVSLATKEVAEDEALEDLAGFSDRTAAALANAAQNRLDVQESTGATFDRMVSKTLTENLEERTRLNIRTFVRTNDMVASTINLTTIIQNQADAGELTVDQLRIWLDRVQAAENALEEGDDAVGTAVDSAENLLPANNSGIIEISEELGEALQALSTAILASENIEELGENLVNRLTVDLIGEEDQPDSAENLINPSPAETVILRVIFVQLLSPVSVTDTYSISEVPMQVAILDGETGDVLGEGIVSPAGEVVTAQIPADGWYVLTKTAIEGEEGTAILDVKGIYPIVERATAGASGSIFVRLTDDELLITAPRPTLDGEDIPMAVLIDNQFRGRRSLQSYLIHFVPLTLRQFERLFLPFFMTVVWGFVIGRVLAHLLGEQSRFNNTTSRIILILLGLSPLLLILIYFGPVNGDLGFMPMGGIPAIILKIVLAIGIVFQAGQIDSWLNRTNRGEDAEAGITNLLMYGWGIFPILMYMLASGIGGFSAATLASVIGSLVWLLLMYFIGLNFRGVLGYGLLVAGFFLQIAQSFVIDTIWETWTDEPVTSIFIWLVLAVVATGFGILGYSLRHRVDDSIKRLGYLISTGAFVFTLTNINLMDGTADPLTLALAGLAFLLVMGWVFFNGVHHFNSNSMIIGLLLITFLWMQFWTPVDKFSSFLFIVWLGAGAVVFKRGEEAQRNQRKTPDTDEKPRIQRMATPGLFVVAFAWIVVLFVIPAIITALDSAGILQTSPNDLLPLTDKRRWGGFMLTMQITILGIGASFPIGLLLALGRRSNLPIVKTACIIYIETVRGVPLVTVLFMATLLVPLVDPALATIEGVVRVWVGVTMFSAAYLAENVRGGLQSIPSGQTEAAQAIGLSGWQTTIYILLPQALRAVIPALVGQFISLFKDTSLVYIVGLAELLGIAQRVVAQPEFIQRRQETFLYIAIIYFVFSYIMSYISRRVEETGSGAARARQI